MVSITTGKGKLLSAAHAVIWPLFSFHQALPVITVLSQFHDYSHGILSVCSLQLYTTSSSISLENLVNLSLLCSVVTSFMKLPSSSTHSLSFPSSSTLCVLVLCVPQGVALDSFLLFSTAGLRDCFIDVRMPSTQTDFGTQ